jgi:tripartite motif-containing protein 71
MNRGGSARMFALGLGLLSVALSLVVSPPAIADPLPLQPIYGTGAPGGAAGELTIPSGVSVDPAGSVYTADQSNQRISVFNAQGPFLRAYGFDVIPGAPAGFEICTTSCQSGVPGPGAGQLNVPTGVAAAPDGSIFVGEQSTNHRISVFNAQGTFVRAFGFDVIPGAPAGFEVCTASCQAGTAGAAAGQLSTPTGVSVDAGGNLYVADGPNNRISVYTAQGTFLRAFGFDVIPGAPAGAEVCTVSCQAGVAGGGAGQLDGPTGVSVDPAGNVYVADWFNNRISVYTAAGTFERAFGFDVVPGGGSGAEVCTTSCKAGLSGGGAGELDEPAGVGADATGNVYVADHLNHRISVFNADGTFLRAFGFNVIPGGGAGYEVCIASCKSGVPGTAEGQLTFPFSVAVDCRGAVYVDGNNRIERFGEPGTQLPPCPPPTPPPPPPSNQFSFGKLKRNLKKGTAKLTVAIPGPGGLQLAGKLVKANAKSAANSGDEKLSIKPRGKAKRKLGAVGKAKLTISVTFTPTGGDPNTRAKKLKLKLKRRR